MNSNTSGELNLSNEEHPTTLLSDPFTCKLLLVEDEDMDAEIFNRICKKSVDELEVDRVATAEEALRILSEESNQDFDLIVSDIGLPGMSGLELFSEIHQRYPDIPLIILTGAGTENDAIDALHIGVDNYCKKGSGERYKKQLQHTIKEAVIRRRKHDALVKAELELATQIRKVELADRAKVQFMLNISHELRTPLNCVVGFSEALLGGLCGPIENKLREYISDIHKSGQHLHTLIEELLSITDIESGNITASPERVFVADLIKNAVQMVSNDALTKKQTINFKSDNEEVKDLVSYLDRRHFRQILMNLLNNATSYCQQGAEINISLKRVKENNHIEVVLADNGPGVAAIYHEGLFEPFTRPHDSLLTSSGGVGIGLSIVKALCDENGIKLEFESEEAKGTRVCLLLPVV